ESEIHPDFLPDLYESGTQNIAGIAGLNAGVRYILERGVEEIREYEISLTEKLIQGLKEIPGVTVYGKNNSEEQAAVVSFNINDQSPSDIGLKLDEEYDIMCRVGLHCSPSAHKTIGTFPTGTVRFSMSIFNTVQEIEKALMAVRKIASGQQ
ncbi:MAG: aminotransferase class V-fold PLP-dependent enzyme, partial [Atribacterota bacterium]|nr:aminotransferase class V-fold PLP-dependent enzyme [Atribacterota bacterium]